MNNVAIGAAYCKYKYREKARKIAIVDFDVHHGNGTEEIVRSLTKINLSVNNDNKICNFSLNKSFCNPWLDFDDAQNVLFISLHGYDEECPPMFYPSSGSSLENTTKDSNIYPGGILNIPINKLNKNSHNYRNHFRSKVTPRLQKFKPDIIFISAGFDGHENEEINSAYVNLNEFDFKWITEEIMRVANVFANGKVVSVLEGGYNINSGVISSFAQSVMAHTKFLNICLNKNKENLNVLSRTKRKREYIKDLENFKFCKKSRKDVAYNDDEELESREIIINNDRPNIRSKNEVTEPKIEENTYSPAYYDNFTKSMNYEEMNEIHNFSIVNDPMSDSYIDKNVAFKQNENNLNNIYNIFEIKQGKSVLSLEASDEEKENIIKGIKVDQLILKEEEIHIIHNDVKSTEQINKKEAEEENYFLSSADVEKNVSCVKNEEIKTNGDNFDEIEVVMDDEDDCDELNNFKR